MLKNLEYEAASIKEAYDGKQENISLLLSLRNLYLDDTAKKHLYGLIGSTVVDDVIPLIEIFEFYAPKTLEELEKAAKEVIGSLSESVVLNTYKKYQQLVHTIGVKMNHLDLDETSQTRSKIILLVFDHPLEGENFDPVASGMKIDAVRSESMWDSLFKNDDDTFIHVKAGDIYNQGPQNSLKCGQVRPMIQSMMLILSFEGNRITHKVKAINGVVHFTADRTFSIFFSDRERLYNWGEKVGHEVEIPLRGALDSDIYDTAYNILRDNEQSAGLSPFTGYSFELSEGTNKVLEKDHNGYPKDLKRVVLALELSYSKIDHFENRIGYINACK